MKKTSNNPSEEIEIKAANQYIERFASKLGLSQEQTARLLCCANESKSEFLDRTSYLMKCHKFATLLLSDKSLGFAWFLKPNTSELLKGETPIHFLLNGDNDDYRDLCAFLQSYL